MPPALGRTHGSDTGCPYRTGCFSTAITGVPVNHSLDQRVAYVLAAFAAQVRGRRALARARVISSGVNLCSGGHAEAALELIAHPNDDTGKRVLGSRHKATLGPWRFGAERGTHSVVSQTEIAVLKVRRFT